MVTSIKKTKFADSKKSFLEDLDAGWALSYVQVRMLMARHKSGDFKANVYTLGSRP